MKRILVVDDDPISRKILERMLAPDYRVASFGNGEEAFRYFVQHGAEVIMTDLKMPRMDGFELLARAKAMAPEVIVFVVTGYSSIDNAVTAIKKGAYDYVSKPFDPDEVLLRLERALKEKFLEEKVANLERQRELQHADKVPLTNHPKMLAALELAKKVARTHSNVLITGETGVGKELFARMVHQWSPRKERPFVPVNCGALAENLLESELFGHEKGAFTGAANKRIGYFELANGGTILLDEIGTTSNAFQVKLLRVFQDRLIYRVGSTASIPIDVRIIASTNQDLEHEAREELFRSDLYYRLSVMTLKVPPLRERKEDIPLLAEHFIRKYQGINPGVESCSDEGLRLLMHYDYPGNVRELENIVERAMILEGGTCLTPGSLFIEGAGQNSGRAEPATQTFSIEETEKEHILRVLEKCGGKKTEAANLLGINKTTLWRKMKKYDLNPEAP